VGGGGGRLVLKNPHLKSAKYVTSSGTWMDFAMAYFSENEDAFHTR